MPCACLFLSLIGSHCHALPTQQCPALFRGNLALEDQAALLKHFISFYTMSTYQIRSVAQSCPTPFDPMNCSMPGLPVHHQLLEVTQTHVHQVRNAIWPSHPLLSPSPPAPNPSQHQSFPMSQLFAWGGQSTGVSALASFLPKNTQDWYTQTQKQSFKHLNYLNSTTPHNNLTMTMILWEPASCLSWGIKYCRRTAMDPPQGTFCTKLRSRVPCNSISSPRVGSQEHRPRGWEWKFRESVGD